MSSGAAGPGASGKRSSTLGKAGNLSLSSTPAGALLAATGGPNVFAASTSASRAGLYAFDGGELEAFSLPPLVKGGPGGNAASPQRRARVGAAIAGAAAATGQQGFGSENTAPQAPPGSARAASGGNGSGPASLSATFSLVKEAFGLNQDESKSQEADEAYASILASNLAATGGAGGKGGAAAAHTAKQRRQAAQQAALSATALPPSAGLTGGDELAAQALLEVETLKTGEQAMAFFQKYGPSCPVKFVHLRRRFPPTSDTYRPYDLVVVPQSEAGDEYYVMSAKGIVFVEPGTPSEFCSLATWMRDSAAFNVCTAMHFFRFYLPRKVFIQWRANVRFNRYCKQRESVRQRLFTWKPAFANALLDVKANLAALERIPLLSMSQPRYTVQSFLDAQQVARADAVKAIERHTAAIQSAIERVCADVTRRARARDDDDDDGNGGGSPTKAIKSMAAARVEAAKKAAALKSAAEEEAMLGPFVRLIDYMTVETSARLVLGQVQALLKDITYPEQRRVVGMSSDSRSGSGMFSTTVKFEGKAGGQGARTSFDPPLNEFLHLAESVCSEAVKAINACPRILYARSVREFVQELPTEAGPGNLSAPTVSMLLQHSPEFAKAREGLDAKFTADFTAAQQYATIFDAVRPLWDYHSSGELERFCSSEAARTSVVALQREMHKVRGWDGLVTSMRMQDARGCLFIDSKRLRQELEPVTVTAMESIKALLMEVARERCKKACESLKQRAKAIDLKPTALDKFASHMERLSSIKEGEEELNAEVLAVSDMYKLLQGYEVKVSSEDAVALDDLMKAHQDYVEAAKAVDGYMEGRTAEMARQLDVSIIKVNDSLKALADTVNEGVFVDDGQQPSAVLEALDGVRNKMSQLEEQARRFNRWQSLFGITLYEFKALATTQKAVQTREQLWQTLHEFETKYAGWTQSPVVSIEAEELARDVATYQKTAFQLDKNLADGVSALLKSKVGDFKALVPIVTDLSNKSMKERHWKKLYETCGQTWYGNNPDRSLSDLMAFRIFEYGDQIADISGSASGEAALEASLQKVITAWGNTNFVIKKYREQKGVFILGGLEEVLTQLEDHQVLLQTMMGSRFIAGVRDEVESWDRKLSLLSDTLDEWIMCQKQWMYLETIFSAEDIQRQLPVEASKFSAVDKRWKDIMGRTAANPSVINSVEYYPNNPPGQQGGEELVRAFRSCNATLEAVQKSLEEYLTTKRDAFPRFYFLSNDELLAILSQTRDPTAVQPHLMKCFDNIKSVEFGAGAASHDMLSMWSGDGENVKFSMPVAAEGNVEDWLTDVESMMRSSIYDQTKAALQRYPAYDDAIDRRKWLFTAPAQSIIVVDQIMWTDGCVKAIKLVQDGVNAKGMEDWLDYNRRQIDSMVQLVREDLTKQQRTLMGAMVVIDVHARDVVQAMVRKQVSSLDDFEWTKQLRFYWEQAAGGHGGAHDMASGRTDPVDNAVVRQTNTRFVYGYEYLGNSDRLVITPLTDQCYMTLTGALHLKFGGAPQGPAGTGKTETTKDLAKALASMCVVFNCSDGIDYKMMGKFFNGLAQAGAWACFDEFNRINIEVLSVIAQQILVIQQGLISRSERINFEGREIPLSPNFGVFITMNPGYAGRTELPDNLKALFRPVAMMVPDYRLIAEIILFSQGFADALSLSYKMVQLYKLASEQLSKQDHYDFGMRAVKSVLVAAGQLKRKEPEVDENILLIRAMRDSNVPKFLEHDLPLFKGILTDLFPGVEVPFVDYGKLQTAIEDQMELGGLQKVPSLITKIIQTHETQLVRHGMMLVGEAGSGKTVNIDVLAKALTQLKREGVVDKDGFFQNVTRFTLNPKSITMGELYGEFNLTTQEWKDGLVATLVREAVKDTSANRKWIVFDGPVDAIWIENMNTVLDDNKMLCLANGERIKLPPTVHMLFEVRDLAVASPATVSRCGMVYQEPLHVGTTALVDTWLQGEIEDLLPDETPRLATLIKDHVPQTLHFLREQCREIIGSQDSNLVDSFLSLLLTLLRPSNGVRCINGFADDPKTAAQKARERWAATKGSSGLDDHHHAGDDEEGQQAPASGAAAVPDSPIPGHERRRFGTKQGMDPQQLTKVVNLAYCFAFVWSFGCNLHDNSRDKFNTFAHKLLRDLLPPAMRGPGGAGEGGSDGDSSPVTPSPESPSAAIVHSPVGHAAVPDLFSYYLDIPSASLKEWKSRMPSFTYSPSQPYFNILVPTIDTTRYSFLFATLMDAGRNVLFSGETGVGKSVIVADAVGQLCSGDEAKFASMVVNFSAQTKSSNLQEALEANLDKKRRNLLGAPAGKRMCIFVDDLNMPQKETYGAQPPIELLRQVIDQGGFYDRQRLFFKQVASCVFAAACAPPGGGRNDVTTRLTRHYHLVWLPQLSQDSMVTIFDAILNGFLTNTSPGLTPFSREIVQASVDLYRRVESELLPTPAKSHYTFNLRDLSKVFQGVLMVNAKELPDKDALIRLWVHEEQRVFRDRLINGEDRDWFNKAILELVNNRLTKSGGSGGAFAAEDLESVLYGDWLTKGLDSTQRQYQRVNKNWDQLNLLLTDYLDEYNVTFPSTMNLVFFRDAIQHVARIARILRQPRGNALLVGVGGSGRRSLCRLAAFMAEYQCSSIEITRGYGVNEWHEDIKKLLMAAGIKGKDIAFVFSDTQIVKESFLEDINNILNSGDVPNLYAPDEMEQIINGCRAACKNAGKVDTRANIFNHYIQQAREHLHIVLCMSPIGAAFRTRCRQFPSLVNCCTIDWFNAWPEDALYSVAKSFLSADNLNLGELVDPLCAMCVRIHTSVEDASKRYLTQARRYNYTTPTSYLELLRLYVQMLQTQRDIVSKKVARYQGGLTKLASTNAMVVDLQAKLKDLQPVLEKAAADTAELLVQLAADQKEADAAAAIAAKDEAETAIVAANVLAMKTDCQKDLDEALPAYYAAMKALKSLDKKHIQEVKSFANPPRLVGVVLEAVCILMGYKETWDDAKKLMNQMNFLDQLMEFKKDEVSPKIIAKLGKYIKDPEFTGETIAKVSAAATSLCLWVRAIYKYDEVAKTIAPKKEKLAVAEAELASAQAILNEKRASLAKIQARLAELQASYNASLAKREELDHSMQATSLRLQRAHKLTDGLGEEAVRWRAAASQLEADLTNLVGNMALASGCVAYLGAFTSQFRIDLIKDWVSVCKEKGLPVDSNFSFTRLLADPVVVREWNIQGLPADDFSTENGLYAMMGRRWPLMIDPQSQSNRWIRNINREKGLQLIKLSQPDFLRTLENAIRFGSPVLLQDVEEELDPALEPVLLKQVFKKNGQMCLRLGDSDVPMNEAFKLFITTKLANPHYLPEVQIKVTVINFTVTLKGLEDQLLVDVVRHERLDLEAKKDELIVSIANDQKSLKEIEDTILQMLADSKGDILDDENLINSLAQSKVTSKAIGERMREAEVTTKEITEARETYRPVATRGSILYFVIADLANVDSMYQYSLQAFTRLYNMRIAKSAKAETPQARVQILIEDITKSFYGNVCRGLFETHKLFYAFMIGAQVMKQSGEISDGEWSSFLLGSAGAATVEVPASIKAWMPVKAWSSITSTVANCPSSVFGGLLDDIKANAGDAWKAWSTSKAPENEPLPGKWGRVVGGVTGNTPLPTGGSGGGGLTTFQRLLVLRALREEKTVQGVRDFVKSQLGAFFVEPPPFDLEGVYNDSTAQTPIVFVLSPGADPVDYLLKLAKAKGKSADTFKIISLGQGQGPIAERMMEAARKSGDWVCLQNCHLAVSWLPRLEQLLEQSGSPGTVGSDGQPAPPDHPDYRLWLTSMPSNDFPVAVLQNAIKITMEPPRGIKANLIRTFNDLGEKEYESSTKSGAYKRLLFGLAFYHALVLERRKFGPVGWNVMYDFANSDLKTGTMQLKMYLEEAKYGSKDAAGVEIADAGSAVRILAILNNVIGDVTYGGRVTDKWDKRTNLSLLSAYFTPEILESGAGGGPLYKFSESGVYYCPEPVGLADLKTYVESLPLEEGPEVFGLHENAAITLQLKETGELMQTVQTVGGGSRGGGGGGGAAKSSDEIVQDIVADILKKLPMLLSKHHAHPATFAKGGDGNTNSLGVFLEQEIVRFNKLLRLMKSTLEQLNKAVKGLVVMSSTLETMYSCFLLQKVPPDWENAAYPSLKPLTSWCNDLYARIAALDGWVKNGPPNSFWISGFFFPQGFMTGALQVHARKTRLAIDTLDFRTEVMGFDEDKVPAPPVNGAYVYGLYLEGARWDRATKKLADSLPGVLFDRMPVVWLDPCVTKEINNAGRATFPFYKTSKRAGVLTTTGHSSNFVTTLYLPSDKPETHWVRRGAAVLSMLDD